MCGVGFGTVPITGEDDQPAPAPSGRVEHAAWNRSQIEFVPARLPVSRLIESLNFLRGLFTVLGCHRRARRRSDPLADPPEVDERLANTNTRSPQYADIPRIQPQGPSLPDRLVELDQGPRPEWEKTVLSGWCPVPGRRQPGDQHTQAASRTVPPWIVVRRM